MRLNKLWAFLSVLAVVSFCEIPRVNALVSNTVVQTVTALGNGATTNYTISFDFRDNTQIAVYQVDESTSPWTVTAITNGAGAGKFTLTGGPPATTVVMGTAPTSNQFEIIQRVIPFTQTTHFDPAGAFPASAAETSLDYQILLLQNMNYTIAQKIGLSPTSVVSPTPVMPDPVADNFVAYAHTGNNFQLVPNAAPTTNNILQWSGSAWTQTPYTGAQILSLIGSGGGIIAPANGGTGIANAGTLTWGSNNLGFTLTGNSTLVLAPGVNVPLISPMSALGDTLYGGAAGVVTRLAGDTSNVDVFMHSKSIAGVAQAPTWTSSTGTGNVVLATGPTLVAPVLGTPASGVATNLTGTAAGLTAGTVTTNANLTGDVTSVGNASTIAANAVTNAKMATMGANTVKANVTGGSAVPTDVAETSAATASTFMVRDANVNVQANSFTRNYATVATAAGTTTLVVGSPRVQFFTGATTQSVVLPAANTLSQTGDQFEVHNESTAIVTVKDNGSNTLYAIPGCPSAPCPATLFTVTNIGSANGSWDTATGGGVTQLTTKGDTLIYSTTPARHAVPGDYGRLVPDSGATDGWRSASYTQYQNGAPTKNYVQYADFENNATTGWTAVGCATVTAGLPACNGSGGTAFTSANGGRAKGGNTSSPAIDSGSNVAGTYAMNLATTGAGTIGDGYVSSAYTIDPADRGKALSYSLSYKVASGSPVQLGGTTDTYAVAAYSPADNLWLVVYNPFSITKPNAQGAGSSLGLVQTLSTTTSVQFFVYSPVAPTGASSLLFDDVNIGTQLLATGPPMFDATSFTPTGSWVSNSTYTGWYWRDGDKLGMRVKIALAGAPTAATLTVNLPTGLTIDTTKLPATPTNHVFPSQMSGQGAAHSFVGGIVYSSTTAVGVQSYQDGNNAAVMTLGATNATSPYTFANNDFIYFEVHGIPIVGWSSNMTLASQTSQSPTVQRLTSGTTYTATSAGIKWLRVQMVGGGGGGGGAGGAPTSGGTGGDTSITGPAGGAIGVITAKGGGGGTAAGVGGNSAANTNTGTLTCKNIQGTQGNPVVCNTSGCGGGAGGEAPFFSGAGNGGVSTVESAGSGVANSGGGGGGAFLAAASGAGGGASGSGFECIIPNPPSTFTYAIGAAGAAGTGTNGGGVGAAGQIWIEENYIPLGSVGLEGDKPYVFGRRATSDQVISSSGVTIFNTATEDKYSMLNTGTGVITANRAGVWQINYNVEMTAVTAGTAASCLLRQNTTGFVTSFAAAIPASTTTFVCTASTNRRLAVGDTIDVFSTGDASFNIDSNGTTSTISMVYVGP